MLLAALGPALLWIVPLPSGSERRARSIAYRSTTWWREWALLWVAIMATSYAYFWAKLTIPLIAAGREVDSLLWRVDRILHFGNTPGLSLSQGMGVGWHLSLVDYAYGLWLTTLIGALIGMTASTSDTVRRSFISGCLLIWLGGGVLYQALPARGPAFAYPSVGAELTRAMPIAAVTQSRLAKNDEKIRSGGESVLPRVNPTLGVAALPSLHVAFHAFFAGWAFRRRARVQWLLGALTILTFIGSIRTGWHYAIDGYVGIGLAALVLWWVFPDEHGQQSP